MFDENGKRILLLTAILTQTKTIDGIIRVIQSVVFTLVRQVFGLGLEASSPRKLACPWLEDGTIF